MNGYVYLAEMNKGIYKIGSTKNPEQRLDNLMYSYSRIGLHCEAFLWTTYSPAYKAWEIEFHRYFYANRAKDYRGHEWFRFSGYELELITNLPDVLYYHPNDSGIAGLIEKISNHKAIMHSLEYRSSQNGVSE